MASSTDLMYLETVNVVPAVLKINEKRKLGVIRAPSDTTSFRDISTSYSTASVNHEITPPSNAILDPRVQLKWYMEFTFAGADQGSPLLEWGLNDSVRCVPIHQVLSSEQVMINGQSFTFNPLDAISAMYWYTGEDDRRHLFSSTGSMTDRYQDYADYVTYGSAQNPLAYYGENSYDVPRSSVDYTIVSNTNTAAVIRVTLIEPFMLSPFSWKTFNDAPGFAGVKSLTVQMTLSALSRMWSHSSAGKTFTSAPTVTFFQAPEFMYRMYSPNVDTDPYRSLKQYEYSASQIVSNSTNIGAALTGAAISGTSGNVTFPAVPSRVYCYMRQQNIDRTYLTSDAFARIDSVSITWNNRSGLLASANSSDLYNISTQNGLQMTWPQWSKHCGSVLCLEFGKDIPLPVDLTVGMQSSTQFQIQLNCTNTSAGTITYTLYVVYVLQGVMTLRDNYASYTTSLISDRDLARTRASGPTLDDVASGEPFGGALLSGGDGMPIMIERSGGGFLGNVFSAVKRGVSKGLKFLPQVLKAAPAALDIGRSLGVPGASEVHDLLSSVGLKPSDVAKAMGGARGASNRSGSKKASKAAYLARLK